MASVVAESDVVISTAAIPGKQSPLLITEEAVIRMPPEESLSTWLPNVAATAS